MRTSRNGTMGHSKQNRTAQKKQKKKRKLGRDGIRPFESRLSQGIEYQLRESRRAKHVSIKISTWGEVEIVVPVGFDRKQIPEILNRREEWIRSTQQRMMAERAKTSDDIHEECPREIALQAVHEVWTVQYRSEPTEGVTAKVTDSYQLTLTGQVETVALCQSVLRQWIRSYARRYLLRQLNDVSQTCNLPYRNLTVRRQKTRWGSCSDQHNINLNDKLLFLPPDLVHYVLVHELCHTIHLNHSKQFWALVGQHESQYRRLDRELRTAWRYVPQWLES